VVAAPTPTESARAWAAELARSRRQGLAATKRLVAALRAGRGDEPAAYGAAHEPEVPDRIRAFLARRPKPAGT
jgi:hypothetical protein